MRQEEMEGGERGAIAGERVGEEERSVGEEERGEER